MMMTLSSNIIEVSRGLWIVSRFFYNIPPVRETCCIPNWLRLAESEENIVGIKDSSGVMTGITRMVGNVRRFSCHLRHG